jgi:tetratricopeptide (TPR) repeat protein
MEPSTQAPRWRIEPTQRVTNSGETASGYYALGRYYQGQDRIQLAIVAYRSAVALDPKYAEAHNALGAISAMQGRLDEAIAEFRTAVELAPSAPHILSNLGYALTLHGRVSEAIPLLRRAAALDPNNGTISVNLGLAVSKVEKVAVTTAPEVPAAKSTEAPAVASAAHGVELAGPSEQATAPSTQLATAPQQGSDAYRLEIANGMGLTGAAAKTGEWLAREGAPKARLRNQRPFKETTTVIYFARGFEPQAQRLAANFGTPAVPVQQTLLPSSDVRIVIGRDMLPLLMSDRLRPRVQQAAASTGA